MKEKVLFWKSIKQALNSTSTWASVDINAEKSLELADDEKINLHSFPISPLKIFISSAFSSFIFPLEMSEKIAKSTKHNALGTHSRAEVALFSVSRLSEWMKRGKDGIKYLQCALI